MDFIIFCLSEQGMDFINFCLKQGQYLFFDDKQPARIFYELYYRLMINTRTFKELLETLGYVSSTSVDGSVKYVNYTHDSLDNCYI